MSIVSRGSLHHNEDNSEIYVCLVKEVTTRYVKMECICSYNGFNRAGGA